METLAVAKPAATLSFNTLNRSWWAAFLNQTTYFSQTSVFRDALTPPQVDQLSAFTMQALNRICTRASSQNGFRVYLDGHEQSEADKQSSVFAYPPQPGESLSGWAARVFDHQKFGLIINQIEKFSAPLAEAVSVLIQPLLEQVGIPLNGFHTSTFIGNYGYTPLGIHQDHRGSSVIHLHLGPGEKIMYNWEESLYNQLAAGKPNNKDIDPLLPHATAYQFGAGDIYFMPWNQYHIGVSNELSVGLTFWFDNHTSDVILNKLFDLLKGKFMNRKAITSPQRPGEGFTKFGEVMSALNTDMLPPGASLREMLATVHQESLLTLFSNGGWRFRPLSLRHDGQAVDPDQLLDGHLQTIYPFRLYHRPVNADELLVYCRGAEFQTPASPGLVRVLDRLNLGEPVATRTLLADLADWPTDTALYVLQLLVENRGLRLV